MYKLSDAKVAPSVDVPAGQKKPAVHGPVQSLD